MPRALTPPCACTTIPGAARGRRGALTQHGAHLSPGSPHLFAALITVLIALTGASAMAQVEPEPGEPKPGEPEPDEPEPGKAKEGEPELGERGDPDLAGAGLFDLDDLALEPGQPAPVRITASQSVDRALDRHPELGQARLRLRRAETLARGEGSLLSPVLRVDGNLIHDEEPTQSLFEEGVRVTDIARTQTQLIKRFGWGMDLTLQFEATRFESEQPFVLPGGIRQVQRIGPNWQESLSLSLRQPLLKGFGAEVNEAPLRAALGQRDAARLDLERSASQALLEVLVAHSELSFAQATVAVRRRQQAIAGEQREATEALVAAGSLAEIELDVIDQRLALFEESVLVAGVELISRRAELSRLIGDDDRTAWGAEAVQLPLPAIADADALVDLARAQNPEIATLRAQVGAQRIALEISRDGARPQLDLSASVSQSALSEEGFLDAAGQIAGLDATSLAGGLVLTVPLDNGRAEARLEADGIELQRIEAQIAQAERQIDQQVREALRLVELGLRRVALSDRAAALSRRTLEAERARFRAGRSTNQQVLQFQDDLQRAEERAQRARVDLTLAALRAHHLTGSLLRVLGVEVLP